LSNQVIQIDHPTVELAREIISYRGLPAPHKAHDDDCLIVHKTPLPSLEADQKSAPNIFPQVFIQAKPSSETLQTYQCCRLPNPIFHALCNKLCQRYRATK